jgi:hypothetical protein
MGSQLPGRTVATALNLTVSDQQVTQHKGRGTDKRWVHAVALRVVHKSPEDDLNAPLPGKYGREAGHAGAPSLAATAGGSNPTDPDEKFQDRARRRLLFVGEQRSAWHDLQIVF